MIAEHKLNICEKQDDIKHLKEECDIDDKNEVQEISASKPEQERKDWQNYCGKVVNNLNKVVNQMYGAWE